MRMAVAIIRALRRLPGEHWQRVDGLRCEDEIMPGSQQSFVWSLRALVILGIVERKRSGDLRPLWQYRLAPGLREFNSTELLRA